MKVAAINAESKKIVAINASPRKDWNTGQLVKAAAKGAEENGAFVTYVDLYRLEKFTGCVSCFGCKLEPNKGKCVCKDGLAGTLEKIRRADALIIGSPIYFGDLSAGFRAFYERLMFQFLTYCPENPCCNPRKIPVVLLTTSNVNEEQLKQFGTASVLENYKQMLSKFVGPTTVVSVTDTLQVSDYSQYKWTAFDPSAKLKRNREQFPLDLKNAYEIGHNLA